MSAEPQLFEEETYDSKRRMKWVAGREERGLPPDAPFEGDPRFEYEMEALDSPNYLDEMLRQGWITRSERDTWYAIHKHSWDWIRKIQRREHGWEKRNAG